MDFTRLAIAATTLLRLASLSFSPDAGPPTVV
jgi:hypothetical protein